MLQYIILTLKGIGMGAANVIPGVSGGTIALITGILERLLNAIKSFNLKAVKLLFSGKFRELSQHLDLYFLISVFLGIGIAILSLAKILGYLFDHYPIHVWAFFFGLILASVYYVSKLISKINFSTVFFYLLGTGIAVTIALLSPAKENDSLIYLALCGVVAVCAMILPGISGSFILLVMGNYQLVMIDAVSDFEVMILLPVVVGAVIGLFGFSYLLSWVYSKFRNQTIAILSGFILGSLWILWPWKQVLSTYVNRHGETVPLIQENVLPGTYEQLNGNSAHLFSAIILMLVGIATIWLTETMAQKGSKPKA